jgi:soluble lytic murein transglycosylase-like protein
MKPVWATAAALCGAFAATIAPTAATAAASLQALSATDASLYAAAFDAAERGDNAATDRDLAQVSDPCLVGRVQYVKLTQAAPRKASYADLVGWLKAFAELPGAQQIYSLALKLKPVGEHPPTPATPILDATSQADPAHSRAARETYFTGDFGRALALAEAAGDDWMAGLAAYRLADFAKAEGHFEAVARKAGEADEDRAAGAFWAARSAILAKDPDRADALFKIAATLPTTFYGMIASRRLELAADPLGRLMRSATEASVTTPIAINATGFEAPGVASLIASDPRARRAVALSQIGRRLEAGSELRTGMALAADNDERWAWTTLAVALNPERGAGMHLAVAASAPVAAGAVYPTPDLAPLGGFTIDKALVYAVAWRESRFDALAVSPVGAIGLMQVMPASAADVAGEDWLKSDPIPLFDPPTNLRIGQDYVAWLIDNAAGHDLLLALAAYNGGTAMLQRSLANAGPGADSLLVVESAPFVQSRAYVRKVMVAYWSYRRQFGHTSPTLDALASGAGSADARLDR